MNVWIRLRQRLCRHRRADGYTVDVSYTRGTRIYDMRCPDCGAAWTEEGP